MRCNKTISFNLNDLDDLQLFEHALKVNPLTGKPQNFSKYVKRLIENDIKGISKYITTTSIVEGEKTIDEEVKNAMTSFL